MSVAEIMNANVIECINVSVITWLNSYCVQGMFHLNPRVDIH